MMIVRTDLRPAGVLGVLLVLGSVSAGTGMAAADPRLAREDGISPHERLSLFHGAWAMTLDIHRDPSQPPVRVEGTLENSAILSRRYVQLYSEAPVQGFPHESMTVMGFDGETGEYTLYGIDNLASVELTARGLYDPGTWTFVFTGFQTASGARTSDRFEVRYRFLDADHYVLEYYHLHPDRPPVLALEGSYSRR